MKIFTKIIEKLRKFESHGHEKIVNVEFADFVKTNEYLVVDTAENVPFKV